MFDILHHFVWHFGFVFNVTAIKFLHLLLYSIAENESFGGVLLVLFCFLLERGRNEKISRSEVQKMVCA